MLKSKAQQQKVKEINDQSTLAEDGQCNNNSYPYHKTIFAKVNTKIMQKKNPDTNKRIKRKPTQHGLIRCTSS